MSDNNSAEKMVMDPELKAKWVEALRSGKYKQTSGELRATRDKPDGYCCLGVLCSVQGIELGRGDGMYGNIKTGFVPPEWLNIDLQRVLARKNDELETFEEIANYIDENL